jgi:hypothetical protein
LSIFYRYWCHFVSVCIWLVFDRYLIGVVSVCYGYYIDTRILWGVFIGIWSVSDRYLIGILLVLYRYGWFLCLSSACHWYLIGILSVLTMLGFPVVHVKVGRQAMNLQTGSTPLALFSFRGRIGLCTFATLGLAWDPTWSVYVFDWYMIGIWSVSDRYLIGISLVLYRYGWFLCVSSACHWYLIGILSVLTMLGFPVVHVKVGRQAMNLQTGSTPPALFSFRGRIGLCTFATLGLAWERSNMIGIWSELFRYVIGISIDRRIWWGFYRYLIGIWSVSDRYLIGIGIFSAFHRHFIGVLSVFYRCLSC